MSDDWQRARQGQGNGNGGRDGATERWVKWVIGLLMPVIGALVWIVLSDHTEMAVMREKQDNLVSRQLDVSQDVAQSLRTVTGQHQLMIQWQEQMTEFFKAEVERQPKAPTLLQRGYPKFGPQ